MRKLYMHTLDDRPAEFHDRNVCFAFWKVQRFATSLKQIRQEHRTSAEWDVTHGYVGQFKYGYRLLYIPDKEAT